MREFAELMKRVDSTNKTNKKVMALSEYLSAAPPEDKLWAIALLIGKRPRRVVPSGLAAEWASEMAGIPYWLFRESYQIVGDLSETISLILPDISSTDSNSLAWWMDYILQLEGYPVEKRQEAIISAWKVLGRFEIFVFNKLINGNFRIGVSRQLVIRALAESTGKTVPEIAHRLTGNWSPMDTTFDELFSSESGTDISKPYPFFLAHPLESGPEALGEANEWQAEWKWDGIRGQIIKRSGEIFIWTRGEELATERFPELAALVGFLPDGTVLDGEILPYKDREVLPFALLQTRIGRKKPSGALLKKVPVAFFAYDLLELDGEDLRNIPLDRRRKKLEELIRQVNREDVLLASPVVDFTDWSTLVHMREQARERSSEGMMIKRLSAPYEAGRKKGGWWKWKVDPFSIDAVLIYAQKGSGKRAGLYTDYTFALWGAEGELIPFAKAYSGLTNEEINKVNHFIRQNTLEKFGPVRQVAPELVFEIGFEGINLSQRHKSGVAVRFPRILRWRTDKKPADADSLENLKKLLDQRSSRS